MTEPPLLAVEHLAKDFAERPGLAALLGRERRILHAVRDVSFRLAPGETLGVVGESGCGKSTLGRCIAGLHQPTAGRVLWRGQPTAAIGRQGMSRRIQMVFQDPYASLNPRMTLGQTLDEVLAVHRLHPGRGGRRDRIDQLLLTVGLSPSLKDRLPHAFSGGQRQRISIARALAAEPELIIADEPVSALDASVQAQIINLFVELREALGLAYLFVAHDLTVVRHVSQRIAVMYLGQIVELADADALFEAPLHPYARALLSAIPLPDPDRRTEAVGLAGEPPDPYRPPLGCSFSNRCPVALPACRREAPALLPAGEERLVRCPPALV